MFVSFIIINSLRGGLASDSSLCDWFPACCMAPWVFTDGLSQRSAGHQAKTQVEGLAWGIVPAVLLSASCLFAFRFCGLFCCAELRWMLRSRCPKNMSMLSAAGSPSASAVSMMTSWHRPRKGGPRVGLGPYSGAEVTIKMSHLFLLSPRTKETLATGHFMSVINILMQLRKVCNHPNLFDPRPVTSPFITPGICFSTASLVLRATDVHPLQVSSCLQGYWPYPTLHLFSLCWSLTFCILTCPVTSALFHCFLTVSLWAS